MFQVYFESIKNLVMKYTSSIYFEFVFEMDLNLLSGSEVYLLELDFQDVCIYDQIQKYTWSRLSKLTNLHSKFEV